MKDKSTARNEMIFSTTLSPDAHTRKPECLIGTIPGVYFRRYAGAADDAGIAALFNASNAADGGHSHTTARDIAALHAEAAASNMQPERDLMLGEAEDGAIVAYARQTWLDQTDGFRRYTHAIDVHPRWRQHGIGRALLLHYEGLAHSIEATQPTRAKAAFIHAFIQRGDAGAHALLKQTGFRVVRESYAMTRDLRDPIPEFALPEGFEIRPLTPEHHRALWDADQDAFRDHNDNAILTDSHDQAWLNSKGFQPEHFVVAWHIGDNRIAAFVRTYINADENTAFHQKNAYTEGIGTVKAYRKRGLARALLCESMRRLRAQGYETARLDVDASNQTGALRVYEACGFKVGGGGTVYRKLIPYEIALPGAPDIPGLRARRFAGHWDVSAMTALINARNDASHAQIRTLESEVINGIEHADPERENPYANTVLVEIEREPVAYVERSWMRNDDGEIIHLFNGFVRPEWTRRGLGSALLRWAEAQAEAESLAKHAGLPVFLQAHGNSFEPALAALLDRHGYTAARHGVQMLRDLDLPIPDVPMPAGLVIKPVTRETARPVFDALNEAFRDHWNHREWTDNDYQSYISDVSFQPEKWLVAYDESTGEVAGCVLNVVFPEDNAAFGLSRGWTDPIGVRRAYRRRGLASALLVRSMQLLKDAGLREAALTVDMQNPSGAMAIYEKLGFRVERRHSIYRKALAMPAQAAVPGVTFRRYRDEADFERMAAILNAIAEAERLDEVYTVAGLRNLYLNSSTGEFSIERDLMLAERDGGVVGFARTRMLTEPGGLRRHVVAVQVHPAHQRQGIGSALFGWLEKRTRDKQAHNPHPGDSPAVFESWVAETVASGNAFLVRNGFQAQRHYVEMRRDLSLPIEDIPLPPDFEFRPALPEHYRAVYDADVNAFRDHYGFIEPGESDYTRWLNDPIKMQPHLWKVIWHIPSNTIASQVLNQIRAEENAKLGVKRGWTEDIGTQRRFRKLGLARAAIHASMRMFKDMGMTETMLSADAENTTGAIRLYKSCGYEVVKVGTMYRREF